MALRTTSMMVACAALLVWVAPAVAAPKPGAGRCVVAGGSADMVTRGLSEFMAKAALKNSIAGMGAKPAGPIKLTCDSSIPVHCLAKQKACK